MGASSGAIPALLVILGTCSVELQAQVAVILYNLVNNSPERQNAVAKSGAIPPLVSLLKSQNPSLLTEVLDTLRVLTVNNAKNCFAIIDAGGISPLLALVRGAPAKVKQHALLLKEHLAKHGGHEAIRALATA